MILHMHELNADEASRVNGGTVPAGLALSPIRLLRPPPFPYAPIAGNPEPHPWRIRIPLGG